MASPILEILHPPLLTNYIIPEKPHLSYILKSYFAVQSDTEIRKCNFCNSYFTNHLINRSTFSYFMSRPYLQTSHMTKSHGISVVLTLIYVVLEFRHQDQIFVRSWNRILLVVPMNNVWHFLGLENYDSAWRVV